MFYNRCPIAWHFAKLIHLKYYNMPPTPTTTENKTARMLKQPRNKLKKSHSGAQELFPSQVSPYDVLFFLN